MFDTLRVLVAMIVLGILIFAAYAWLEFRHNAKRTRELADHVRKYYEERDRKASVIEGRKVL